MESFPVNIDAEQVVRWIMAEQAAAPSTFKTTATRTTEVREIPARREYHLGDEEREDLSEVGDTRDFGDRARACRRRLAADCHG